MTAPSTARNPLLLPEILCLVLSFITDDCEALASATRVNKLWFDHSTPLVWDGAPWEAFMRLKEHHRIQEYAPRIRRLVCTRAPPPEGSSDTMMYGPVHPRIDPEAEAVRRGVMRQFFHSGTHQVVLRNFLTDGFLQEIGARCGNLRRLHIDSRYGGLKHATLIHVLSRLDALEDISILALCPSANSSDLLLRLAEKPILRSVRARIMFTTDKLRQIKTTVPRPFQKLRKLYARTASSAVPLLIDCIGNVTTLHLHVMGGAAVLQHVARLTALTSLEVQYHGRGSLTSAEVMALQPLDGLTTLRLCDARNRRRFGQPDAASDLSSHDFEQLLSKMGSRLAHLELNLPCIIVDALSMVARHCPLLRSFRMRRSPCHLPAPTDSQWSGAMCPELRLLLVWSLGGDPERDSNNPQHGPDLAQRLRVLMPKLKYPMVMDQSNPDRSVLDVFHYDDPTSVANTEYCTRRTGCPHDRCVGYSFDGHIEEELSEDYDENRYNSNGNDSS